MRAGPLSSPKVINLLNTHFVNVWVLLRELPALQTGAKGAAVGALATKLRQHYSDSVDILTLTPELEVIEHLPSKSLLHPDYLPRSEWIPRYLELLKSSVGVEVVPQKPKKLGKHGLSSRLANAYKEFGKPAPDFSTTDLDGEPISLQQYRGKVVLLDFWAVWNGFCVGEMLRVKKIYDTYKDQGFDIIGVSLDTDETKLRNYLQENDIPWRQIYSGLERQSPLAQQYDVRSIPARWLVDRDGKLIAHEAHHKLISRKGREADLEQLVAEAVTNEKSAESVKSATTRDSDD